MRTWIILDVNYLCHRAYYATGQLHHEGRMTGVVFGLMRDLVVFRERFGSNKFVFCFDSVGKGHRETVYPAYKAKRRRGRSYEELTTEEKFSIDEFRRQVQLLRTTYLPEIGFENIFCEKGYESDDLIACVCKGLDKQKEQAYIVSADTDLWQLIRRNVHCYNPTTKELLTRSKFIEQWGITPKEWVQVKAIAGCNTDNVLGIKGVGNITAAKYLKGQLKPGSDTHKAIEAGKQLWEGNLRLVRLPYDGCPPIKLRHDEPNLKGWKSVAAKLGITSVRELGVL